MKIRLLLITFLAIVKLSIGQNLEVSYWKSTVKKSSSATFTNKIGLTISKLFSLDINSLKNSLVGAPKREAETTSNIIVSFPDENGIMARFSVLENSNMDPKLAARYPEINSYVGQGIDDPSALIYFSISPLGLQTMLISADKPAVFIEPYTTDLSSYVVYSKSDKSSALNTFDCAVLSSVTSGTNLTARPNADDGMLRTYRLALSVTGEYTIHFGGTKPLALAAMNATMTRVNGVFEIDFGVHMNLIANNDVLIYTNASSDPYSPANSGANGAWNQELQTNLTSTIGNANYDIGHLFGATGGGGNAGCIGCVCVNPTGGSPLAKGSGFTSPIDAIPQGDNFDIDYVAHEMGHQFGGNHTFTFSNEGTVAQCEPGSGSTIMGYAGITGSNTDIQAHSDAFFHAISIQQITNYIKTTSCQTNTTTGNAIPTANAGLDYTIPKGTPFILTGAGTDANGDVLTFCWEQMNAGNSSTTLPSVTATTGPAFKSFLPTTSPIRYFPQLSIIKTGATSWKWEAVPNVARTMNFRLTVRDNRAGGPANNSDDMIVTVNATAGPFSVTAPNTAVSWMAGSSQTITWSVAGTTANSVNAANVDILLSTDGGNTYPITVLSATPNDGTQSITVPNNPGTQNRIMVKGSNHIFFDISNTNFTITNPADVQAPSIPINLAASGTTSSTTNLTWDPSTDNVGVTGYDVYKDNVFLITVATNSYTVPGLTPSTSYAFFVKARDFAGNISGASNIVNVTTLCSPVNAVSVLISSNPAGPVCPGTNVIFTATPTNPGTTPIYQWQKNGTNVGINSSTYSDNNLNTGTLITCILTSNVPCPSGNPATSNTISLNIVTEDDFNPCTIEGCNTSSGVTTHIQVNSDDENACTVDGCNSSSSSSLLISNDINFSGTLTSNGWTANSQPGINPITTTAGLIYTGIPGSNIGNAAILGNIGGEDDNITFAGQYTNGQDVYYSVMVNVTDAASSKTGDYFLHLGKCTGSCTSFTLFAARLWVRIVSDNVNFGITNTSSAVYGPTNYSKNTTYLLIVKYTINTGGNDATSLWVIPSGVPSSEVSAGIAESIQAAQTGVDSINAIGLRQGSNSASVQTIVDGIRVGRSWASVTSILGPGGIFHNPISTDDGDACTADVCDTQSGSISHLPISFDDNNVCTTDGCDSSTGIYHDAISSDDDDVCTIDGCDSSTGIFHNPVSADDGNACTIDGCNSFTGVFHNPVSADDGDVCTIDGCNSTTGIFHNPVNLDDGNDCNTDGCDSVTGIYHDGISADDGDVCTNDFCNTVIGVFHTPKSADDENPCTMDGCDSSTGVFHNPVSADDGDPCTTDGCISSTGVFHNPVSTDDGNLCTTDGCESSTGIFHNPVSDDDGNVCTLDGCNSLTGVFHNPISSDDGNACTTDDCDSSSGVFHNPVSTDDENVCTTDGCDSSTGVYHNLISSDDTNPCTTDGCNSTSGIFHNPVNPDDGIACTVDGCNSVTGVFHTPVNCTVTLHTNLFLEGYYIGPGVMNNCLFATGLSLDPTDADFISISAMSPISPFTQIDSKTATLKTNGDVQVTFDPSVIPGNSYYLKVSHRNAVTTWSASPVMLSSLTTYIFSDDAGKAFGNNQTPTHQLGNGPDGFGYAFYSGDIANGLPPGSGMQDGSIDATDFLDLDPSIQNGDGGYAVGDLNGDGSVDATDFLIMDPNIQNGVGMSMP